MDPPGPLGTCLFTSQEPPSSRLCFPPSAWEQLRPQAQRAESSGPGGGCEPGLAQRAGSPLTAAGGQRAASGRSAVGGALPGVPGGSGLHVPRLPPVPGRAPVCWSTSPGDHSHESARRNGVLELSPGKGASLCTELVLRLRVRLGHVRSNSTVTIQDLTSRSQRSWFTG